MIIRAHPPHFWFIINFIYAYVILFLNPSAKHFEWTNGWLRNAVRPNSICITHSPWSAVLPEKLTSPQLVKKLTAFYETRSFSTAFTRFRHLSLSSVRSSQFVPPPPFSKIHFNINLPSMPGSSKWFPSLRPPHQNPVCTPPLTHTCYIPVPSHSSLYYHPNYILWGVQIIKLHFM